MTRFRFALPTRDRLCVNYFLVNILFVFNVVYEKAYWSVWFWLLDLGSRHGAMFCHLPLTWVTWAVFNRLGNAEFKPVDGVRGEGLQRLVTFRLLSVQMHLEERSRMESWTIVCYQGVIWRRLEPLERNYGRFPSVDLLVRFAGVSNLVNLYV